MYTGAGRDFRLPPAGREKKSVRGRLKLMGFKTCRLLPLSAPATRGNGNTSDHLCKFDFYRYRDLLTWKHGFIVISSFRLSFCPSVCTPFHSCKSKTIPPIKVRLGGQIFHEVQMDSSKFGEI